LFYHHDVAAVIHNIIIPGINFAIYITKMKYIWGIIIVVAIIIVLLIELPWSDCLKYSLKNNIKNKFIKFKHRTMHVPLNINICKENLELFADILNKYKLNFWLSEGTALGAIREGNFILHDDDVDIGMWYTDFDRFRTFILPELKLNGFTCDEVIMNNTFVGLSRKGEKIDIDFTGYDIECMSCKTSNANCVNCNIVIDKLDNMKNITFLGKQYLCPDTDYLEYLYGPNWKTPIRSK